MEWSVEDRGHRGEDGRRKRDIGCELARARVFRFEARGCFDITILKMLLGPRYSMYYYFFLVPRD